MPGPARTHRRAEHRSWLRDLLMNVFLCEVETYFPEADVSKHGASKATYVVADADDDLPKYLGTLVPR